MVPAPQTLLDINLDRRQFLTLMGASLGLAGVAGCEVPPDAGGTYSPRRAGA